MKNLPQNKITLFLIFGFYSTQLIAEEIKKEHSKNIQIQEKLNKEELTKPYWCEFLTYQNSFSLYPEATTKVDCLKNNELRERPIYKWLNTYPSYSNDGNCLVGANDPDDPNFLGYYPADQRGCENHNTHSIDRYYWIPNSYPMLYVGKSKNGFGQEFKISVPDLAAAHPRLVGLIASYHLPEPWVMEACSEENFNGECIERAWHNAHDQNDLNLSFVIKSIKITNAKKNIPITSFKQAYLGTPSLNTCGDNGRLLTADEMKEYSKNMGCRDIVGQWQISQFTGEDGTPWSAMGWGSGYRCSVKKDVNPASNGFCTMIETPPLGHAFIFNASDFQGQNKMEGEARVKAIGKYNEPLHTKSFKLANDVILIGYLEKDFIGTSYTFIADEANVTQNIQSYEITDQ